MIRARNVGGTARHSTLMLLAVALQVSCEAPKQTPLKPPAPAAELQPVRPLLQTGFQEDVVFSSLNAPTVIQFAPDGRVFVAEKSGRIVVFDSLSDPTPDVFADLRPEVHDFWDRGLLGMALHPQFPAEPWVYVLYTRDALPGGASPQWGDQCPSPPGPTQHGCVVTGRLSRLRAQGNAMIGAEEVLIEDFGQQFPSHSIGGLAFGADGALYATMGDGASFEKTDWGQLGSPVNPLGDPPGEVGTPLEPTTGSGGAFRTQSLRRPAGQPVLLHGAVIRVSATTGRGLTDNPLSASPSANAARIVAYGLRNPFRITMRPGTNEAWVGDVGWDGWEEVNRVAIPTDAAIENFGWPCYEGANTQRAYQSLGNHLCTSLASTAVTAPFFAYPHKKVAFAGDSCNFGTSAISGLAFYEGTRYPETYRKALFLADYARGCIWVMPAGADGLPVPAQIFTFNNGAGRPVDLKSGPHGDIFYADIWGGTIRRIRYAAPEAVASADVVSGTAPLVVGFDGSASTPGVEGALTYAWDLDGDGEFDDGTATQVDFTYTVAGRYAARLRVTNVQGLTSVSPEVVIAVGAQNVAPVVTIESPLAGTKWAVGDVIALRGSAVDPEDGALPPSSLTWTLVMQHCPQECHAHVIQTIAGVASASFSAPDHEYPSHLEVVLTATDAQGLASSTTLRLDPQTSQLTLEASPQTTPGLQLVFGAGAASAPFSRTVIVGAPNGVTAPLSQTIGDVVYDFVSWSDGGAATHAMVVTAANATVTARYAARRLTAGTGLTGTFSQASTGAFVTRLDPVVDFNWGGGAPAEGIGADNFTVAWTGFVVPKFSEPVTFTTLSDDGIRLWIDDVLIINNWTDHGPTRDSGTVVLTAGTQHRIRLEYYERGGGAVARLLWSSPSFAEEVVPTARLYPSGPMGLRGEYFGTMNLAEPAAVTRTDAYVNFNWGSGSPAAGIGADQFSVRWTGKLTARATETVTFSTFSDDGVRLWLDGQLVIDNWTDHAPTWNRNPVALVAGQQYQVRMEFYERGGGAVAKLLWSSPSFAEEPIPAYRLTP